MRRVFGYVAFTLGCLLVFVSPLLRWYALPRVEKAPTDVYDKTISLGSGTYFSTQSLSVKGPAPLENISLAKGTPQASDHKVAVISIFQRTFNRQTKGDLDYSIDVYAMDRSTGYAVHCCGERPRHEGYTLKFPFNTDKHTVYPFYDSTARKAFPAGYVRDDVIDNLKVFVFRSKVPDTLMGPMSLPGFLANHPELPSVTVFRWYRAITTVWVEPLTGAIVKGAQIAQQWVTDGGVFVTTLANTNFVNTPASVKDTADRISTKFAQLRLVGFYLPVFGPISGLVLVAAGLVMVLRGPSRQQRRFEPATAPEPGAAGSPA